MREYQNITLSIPKEVLLKVKHIAVEKQTSVSQLLVNSMEEIADQSDLYNQAMKRSLLRMKKYSLGTKGKLPTSKDYLYD